MKILDNGRKSFQNVLKEILNENENASVSNYENASVNDMKPLTQSKQEYSSEKILRYQKERGNSFDPHQQKREIKVSGFHQQEPYKMEQQSLDILLKVKN